MGEQRFPIVPLEGPGSVRLSLEERFAIQHNIFKHQFFAVYRLIGERFGWEEANRMAAEVAEEAVPILVEAYRKKFGLTGAGAALLSQVLQAEFQGEGSDVALLHESDDEAEIDVLCTFGDAIQKPRFKDIPIVDGLCERGCRKWVDDLARTVEPDLRAERLTWMGDGAPRCRFRIGREEGSGLSGA